MLVQPYLNFDGRCEEAIKFYQSAVGAEVIMLMRFKDNPEPPPPGAGPAPSPDKVLHSAVKIGDSTVLASDGHCQGRESFKGFSLSLTVPDEAAAERAFRALGQSFAKFERPARNGPLPQQRFASSSDEQGSPVFDHHSAHAHDGLLGVFPPRTHSFPVSPFMLLPCYTAAGLVL